MKPRGIEDASPLALPSTPPRWSGRWNGVLQTVVVLVVAVFAGIVVSGTMATLAWLLPLFIVLGVAWLVRPHWFCALAGIGYALSQTWLESRSVVSVGGVAINGSQAAMAGVTVLLLARLTPLWITHSRRIPIPRFVVPHAVLVVSACISLVASPFPSTACATIFRLAASTAVLLFAYWTSYLAAALPTYRRSVEIAAVIAAVSGLADLFSGSAELVRREELRAGGTFGSPIQVGTVSLLGVPAFVSRLAEKSRSIFSHAGALLGLVVIGLGLFSAFTRRTLVAAVLFFLALSIRSKRHKEYRFSLARTVLMAVAIGSGVLIVTDSTLQGRLGDLPLVGSGDTLNARIGSGRPLIWGAIVQSLADNGVREWLVGRGLHASYLATEEQVSIDASAHNTYLELLHGQGILGLAAYVWFLVATFRTLRRVAKRSDAIGMLADTWSRYLVAFALAIDMFGSAVYALDTRWFFYLMIGAIIGDARRLEDTGSGRSDRSTGDGVPRVAASGLL